MMKREKGEEVMIYAIVLIVILIFSIKFIIRHPFISVLVIGAIVWYIANIPVAEILTTYH